jgi:hypothetical protein
MAKRIRQLPKNFIDSAIHQFLTEYVYRRYMAHIKTEEQIKKLLLLAMYGAYGRDVVRAWRLLNDTEPWILNRDGNSWFTQINTPNGPKNVWCAGYSMGIRMVNTDFMLGRAVAENSKLPQRAMKTILDWIDFCDLVCKRCWILQAEVGKGYLTTLADYRSALWFIPKAAMDNNRAESIDKQNQQRGCLPSGIDAWNKRVEESAPLAEALTWFKFNSENFE